MQASIEVSLVTAMPDVVFEAVTYGDDTEIVQNRLLHANTVIFRGHLRGILQKHNKVSFTFNKHRTALDFQVTNCGSRDVSKRAVQ